MVVGEFTAANIAADQDRKDQEIEDKIKGKDDHTSLKADISRLKDLAASVSHFTTLCIVYVLSSPSRSL